jgi:hypothetical protein
MSVLEFGSVGRTEALKVFTLVFNVSAATVTANYPVVWDLVGNDGIQVSKPATATLSLLVGIADAAIADDAYGLVQVYGYRASAYMTNDTSQAVAAGDIMIPVNAQWYLDRSAASDGKSGFVYAAEAFATNTTPAAANKKCYIRCL